jgi:hypothetical protein
MKLAELIKIWRDKKAAVNVPDDFTSQTMAKIMNSRRQHPAKTGLLRGIADWFGTARIGQAAAIIIGATIGIVRFVILVEALQN